MIKFPLSIFKISGHSMEPTVKNGSLVLINHWVDSFKIGDIVVFKHGNQIWIKRVKFIKGDELAVEGDNKEDSLDLEARGFLKREEILGKLIFRFRA